MARQRLAIGWAKAAGGARRSVGASHRSLITLWVWCAVTGCALDGPVAAPPPTSTATVVDASVDDDRVCTPADGCALGVAPPGVMTAADARSVTGAPLTVCGLQPLTGFLRDGTCRTGVDDVGAHTVCGVVDARFLAFSKARGNDLVTPRGGFPGLVPGDRWCLCESRVEEALDAGVPVSVILDATHAAALRTLSLETLTRLAAPVVEPATR